jgi:Cu2+-containing amine oxidase
MTLITTAKSVRSLCYIIILILFMSGEAMSQQTPDLTELVKVAKVSEPLTKEERTLAIKLAEPALKANKLLPDRKTFLTSVEVSRDGEAEKRELFERNAVLTYYRYAGDLGIRVYINLARQRAVNVEQLPHFPAPLALEELRLARELVLNDPRFKSDLESLKEMLTVEVVLTRIYTPTDPLFQHRVVHLLLRVGPHNLTRYGTIIVDLTTEKVTIIPNPGRQDSSPHNESTD